MATSAAWKPSFHGDPIWRGVDLESQQASGNGQTNHKRSHSFTSSFPGGFSLHGQAGSMAGWKCSRLALPLPFPFAFPFLRSASTKLLLNRWRPGNLVSTSRHRFHAGLRSSDTYLYRHENRQRRRCGSCAAGQRVPCLPEPPCIGIQAGSSISREGSLHIRPQQLGVPRFSSRWLAAHDFARAGSPYPCAHEWPQTWFPGPRGLLTRNCLRKAVFEWPRMPGNFTGCGVNSATAFSTFSRHPERGLETRFPGAVAATG